MNIDIKTADGEEIEFGGSYYDGRGTEHRVVGIRLTDYRHITKVSLSCLVGKVENLCCVSMRPNELYSTPPDSWEKLEEDLSRGADAEYCAPCYYVFRGKSQCKECRFLATEDESCSRQAFAEILERIRKLRGEDK